MLFSLRVNKARENTKNTHKLFLLLSKHPDTQTLRRSSREKEKEKERRGNQGREKGNGGTGDGGYTRPRQTGLNRFPSIVVLSLSLPAFLLFDTHKKEKEKEKEKEKGL